ncbi:MAG: O-antigen ligase family protein, partial [Acidimicrobiales bacterium]
MRNATLSPGPGSRRASRGPSPGVATLAALAGFAALGLLVAASGPVDALVVVIVLGVWASVVAVWVGPRGVVTASMMAVAASAPLTGVRALGGVALTDVFLAIAAVALLARSARGQQAHPHLAGFWVGLLLIVVGGSLGTFFANDPVPSLLNLLRFAVAAAGPVLIVWAWRPDAATLRRYAWYWVAGALVSGLVGLVSSGDASGRTAGLAGHPNPLAIISSLGAGLALVLAVSSASRVRWAATGAFGILSLVVIKAGSRAGLLVLAVSVAVVVLRTRARRGGASHLARYAVVFVGFGALSGLLLSTGAIELGKHNAVSRFLGDVTTASSDSARAPLLAAGIRTIAERPLTGAGFERALEAHNIYVQIWAAAGLLGLIGLLAVSWTTVRTGLRSLATTSETLISTGFASGYVGYLAGGVFQNTLWDRYVWLHVALGLWIGTSQVVAGATTTTTASPPGGPGVG